MSYVEGFVVPVPAARKDAYLQMAAQAATLFREYGATRLVEAWGDDVPEGKLTDFRGAVKAEEGEVVVFSWLEYPSKAVRDAANAKMRSDPRMMNSGEMPFDGMRMIYGGFAPMLDTTAGAPMGYVDGSLLAVRSGARDAYQEVALTQAAIIREHGATRVVEAWADDAPDGKVTDFRRAVKAEADETVAFSWVEWPSREARDAGWPKICADPRMSFDDKVYDPARRVVGGFALILDA